MTISPTPLLYVAVLSIASAAFVSSTALVGGMLGSLSDRPASSATYRADPINVPLPVVVSGAIAVTMVATSPPGAASPEAAPAASSDAAPPPPSAVRRATAGLNVRSGPSQERPRVGALRAGQQVVVVTEAGGWAQVALDGAELGWGYAAYLEDPSPTPGPTP